jgi:carbon monoxide dehydrogenase subunit G
MDMTGERRIPAPRQKVWDALNDLAVLKACIPGCESLEKIGDTDLKATAAVKIGPIAARFTGKVQLVDLDPPNSYRIQGEGAGGVAGFAKGGANVKLVDDGAGTLLTYDVKAQVGGKIAQLGARLIDATSKQMADMFFDRFTAAVSEPMPAAAAEAANLPHMASIDPAAAPGPVLPIQPGILPQAPANVSIPIMALIPSELFGLPIVAIIGILLYIPIFILIFKSYVFG